MSVIFFSLLLVYFAYAFFRKLKSYDNQALIFFSLWLSFIGGLEFFGRSFLYADFIFLIGAIFVFFSRSLRKKIIADKLFFLSTYVLVLYVFGGVVFGNLNQSTFLFPLKNMVIGLLIYFVARNLINTEKDFHNFVVNNNIFLIFTCLSIINNILSLNYYSVVNDRLIHILPGMPWNSVVAFLCLVLVIAVLSSGNSLLIKFIAVIFSASLILIAGSRQGFFSLVFIFLGYYFVSKRKFISLLVFISFSLTFFFFVMNYFYEFLDYFFVKMNKLEDATSIRLNDSFVLPLLNFGYISYIFVGDGVSNLHNIVTTSLYRFGLLSSLIFIYQLVSPFKFFKGKKINKKFFIVDIKYVYVLFAFIFLFSNFIANIWYQVAIYWYYFSFCYGFFISYQNLEGDISSELID